MSISSLPRLLLIVGIVVSSCDLLGVEMAVVSAIEGDMVVSFGWNQLWDKFV